MVWTRGRVARDRHHVRRRFEHQRVEVREDGRAGRVVDHAQIPCGYDLQRGAALKIISAWYLGVIDDAPGATVFANFDALMFKPTSDVMTIPSYAPAGPNHWNSLSPPLAAMPSF